MSRTITVREFAGLLQNLPPAINDAAIRGLRSAGLRGVGEVQKQISNAEPYPAVDTGATRQSVLSEPISDGAELSVNTPQAAIMEWGARPFMPPLAPLIVWVTRKFQLGGASRKKSVRKKREAAARERAMGPRKPSRLGPKQDKAGRTARAAARKAENEALAIAIAKKVQWKIYHHGIAPRGFFSKAMTVIRSKIAPQEVRRELKELEKRL